jgi:peptide-methionine (S)-S-oxide reductase
MKIVVLIILSLLSMQSEKKESEVVFGGGCFWCTEAIFNQIDGVINVSPGYAGGTLQNPTYDDVCTGETGHAEVIRIRYNPDIIAFEKLLEVFFLTHDPTTLNRQGPDSGTQYRSVVFFTTPDQKKITIDIINQLNEKHIYKNKITTEVSPLTAFFPADNYHQNYFRRNGNQPYCRFIIQPKIEKFRKLFDDLLIK